MNPQIAAFAFMAVCVGALFPVQSAANALLARGIGGTIAATLVSFISGLIVLLCLNALVFRQWPSFSDLAAQPMWLLWVGGIIGATFLSSNVFMAPRFGSAATLAFVMAGQLASALAIDRFGLFAFPMRDLSVGRIGGVALVVVGALLVRLT
ncbi:MAG TPA: DMT family transporter [Roseiarcus sp.]|nr:DMT family transporter [Roseiarcus sp.]